MEGEAVKQSRASQAPRFSFVSFAPKSGSSNDLIKFEGDFFGKELILQMVDIALYGGKMSENQKRLEDWECWIWSCLVGH